MQSLWIDRPIFYDGSQLHSLYAYLDHKILGDSVIAWRGGCRVDFENMIDGEDLLAEATIASDEMLHFIIEVFDRELATGVLIQRLFAAQVKDLLHSWSALLADDVLVRDGDDIYWTDRKLSISIASKSPISTMVHFAVNIVTTGTPVKTCCLQELAVEPKEFAQEVMARFCEEWESILQATRKVRALD